MMKNFLKAFLTHIPGVLLLLRLLEQICDPRHLFRGLLSSIWFFKDLRIYQRLAHPSTIPIFDIKPSLYDRSSYTSYDPHYFFMGHWAIKRIASRNPLLHFDVGSHNLFISMLCAIVPVVFLDYRPLQVRLKKMMPLSGNILQLPFQSNSIHSISCLHVVEHIGLGRYGDSLDPDGTHKAVRELARVVAVSGDLFLALPVGKTKTCFNSHRILATRDVIMLLPEFDLIEFSGVDDQGSFFEKMSTNVFDHNNYSCGLFWFRKKS